MIFALTTAKSFAIKGDEKVLSTIVAPKRQEVDVVRGRKN